MNLCSKCGVELHHDIEHDTADSKDLVRWWCPDHCPQCNAAADDLKASDLWQRLAAEVRAVEIREKWQPMEVSDLLRMKHGDYVAFKRSVSELFGDE